MPFSDIEVPAKLSSSTSHAWVYRILSHFDAIFAAPPLLKHFKLK
jgi:hypothetical protein